LLVAGGEPVLIAVPGHRWWDPGVRNCRRTPCRGELSTAWGFTV